MLLLHHVLNVVRLVHVPNIHAWIQTYYWGLNVWRLCANNCRVLWWFKSYSVLIIPSMCLVVYINENYSLVRSSNEDLFSIVRSYMLRCSRCIPASYLMIVEKQILIRGSYKILSPSVCVFVHIFWLSIF